MQDPDAPTPIDFTPSLIGNFIFDDELYFAQDEAHETVDGYLIATDMLVDRMEQIVKEKHNLDERETFDNINFYPIYNLANHQIQIEGTYWYWHCEEETQDAFQLPLSLAEQEDLIESMEAYCVKSDSRNCMDMLNAFRTEDGLPPILSAVTPVSVADDLGKTPSQETISAIFNLASKTRKDIEGLYGEDLSGHCIEASEKIAARLSSALGIAAKTVEGWCQFDDESYGSDRPWDPHTWVEIPTLDLYIDVTADQFNYGMSIKNEFPAVLVQQGLPHGMRYDEPSWNEYEMEGWDDLPDSLANQSPVKEPFISKLQNAERKASCHSHSQCRTAEHTDHAR